MNSPKRNTVIDRTEEWRGKLAKVGDHDVTYEAKFDYPEFISMKRELLAQRVAEIIKDQTGVSIHIGLERCYQKPWEAIKDALREQGAVNITTEYDGVHGFSIRFKKVKKKS